MLPRWPGVRQGLGAAVGNPVVRLVNRVVDIGMRQRLTGLIDAVYPPAVCSDCSWRSDLRSGWAACPGVLDRAVWLAVLQRAVGRAKRVPGNREGGACRIGSHRLRRSEEHT